MISWCSSTVEYRAVADYGPKGVEYDMACAVVQLSTGQ